MSNPRHLPAPPRAGILVWCQSFGIEIGKGREKSQVAQVESVEMEPCDIVISENLSFFMAEKSRNAVFLYNKGFHLTNQIATFVRKLNYTGVYFFGDFDCQGFSILESLNKRIENVNFNFINI